MHQSRRTSARTTMLSALATAWQRQACSTNVSAGTQAELHGQMEDFAFQVAAASGQARGGGRRGTHAGAAVAAELAGQSVRQGAGAAAAAPPPSRWGHFGGSSHAPRPHLRIPAQLCQPYLRSITSTYSSPLMAVERTRGSAGAAAFLSKTLHCQAASRICQGGPAFGGCWKHGSGAEVQGAHPLQPTPSRCSHGGEGLVDGGRGGAAGDFAFRQRHHHTRHRRGAL